MSKIKVIFHDDTLNFLIPFAPYAPTMKTLEVMPDFYEKYKKELMFMSLNEAVILYKKWIIETTINE